MPRHTTILLAGFLLFALAHSGWAYSLLGKLVQPSHADANTYTEADAKTSGDSEEDRWLQQLISDKVYMDVDKRMAGNFRILHTRPSDKRNDGMWIWMPSQGYISVPKDSALSDMESGSSKAMRYGK